MLKLLRKYQARSRDIFRESNLGRVTFAAEMINKHCLIYVHQIKAPRINRKVIPGAHQLILNLTPKYRSILGLILIPALIPVISITPFISAVSYPLTLHSTGTRSGVYTDRDSGYRGTEEW